MAKLFFQYLALHNKDNLPNIINNARNETTELSEQYSFGKQTNNPPNLE